MCTRKTFLVTSILQITGWRLQTFIHVRLVGAVTIVHTYSPITKVDPGVFTLEVVADEESSNKNLATVVLC